MTVFYHHESASIKQDNWSRQKCRSQSRQPQPFARFDWPALATHEEPAPIRWKTNWPPRWRVPGKFMLY